MKTEVKFRELPEKVQGFLKRMFEPCYPIAFGFDWLHNLPEWSQATDEERLAYAEWMFGDGVYYIGVGRTQKEKSSGIFESKDMSIWCIDNNGFICRNGKWAGIIQEPEEKPTPGESINEYRKRVIGLGHIKEASPEAQQEFVKANPDMQHVEEQKSIGFKEVSVSEARDLLRLSIKPKAGDMVEARIDGWPDGTWRDRKYLCKNSFGKFVCEYEDGSVERFDEIRLPQKSEVESKAKELMGSMLPLKFTGFENTYVNWDEAKEKIIEAIKWGQANHGKI